MIVLSQFETTKFSEGRQADSGSAAPLAHDPARSPGEVARRKSLGDYFTQISLDETRTLTVRQYAHAAAEQFRYPTGSLRDAVQLLKQLHLCEDGIGPSEV